MPFNIASFRSGGLQQGGARANLFECTINLKTAVASGWQVPRAALLCRTGQIPASTIAAVEIQYFGRSVKVPGNRTFEPLSLTFINDEDWKLRNSLESWLQKINSHQNNTATTGVFSTTNFGTILLTHYGKEAFGSKGALSIASYTFVNCWPTSIAAIDLGWDQNDAIEEFTVEFAYDYWTAAVPGGVPIT